MLTVEEKRVVARYLAQNESVRRLWWDMSPYLVPPAAFAAYGLWKHEIAAVALAFAVLLFLAIWYLAHQSSSWVHLQSAVRKYEEVVKALEKSDTT